MAENDVVVMIMQPYYDFAKQVLMRTGRPDQSAGV